MAEKALIIHEDEAAELHHILIENLKRSFVDATDDEQWSMLLFLKNLEEKLRSYLEGSGSGQLCDVVELHGNGEITRVKE